MSDDRSRAIITESNFTNRSHLIKAIETGLEGLKSYEDIPTGIFGFKSCIKSGNITINSDDLDFEFTIPFDDDLETNEAEIIIYNLSDNTINNLNKGSKISVEAGYKEDTGVIFDGYIENVKSGYDGVDRVTTITCYNIEGTETVEDITYSENTTASSILKDLISKIGMPIAVFSPQRDYTYTSSVTINGNLREEIKNYAEVCGVSVYAVNGSIYARYIKDGDNINFTVNEDTGLVESPEYFTESITAEDYIDEIEGYEVTMLLQHRITTAAIVNLSSREISGTFRVREGEHTYADGEALTTFKAIGNISTTIEVKEDDSDSDSGSSNDGNIIVNFAKKYIGTPYVYGGYSTSGFDCSAFVSYVMINCSADTKVSTRMTSTALYNMSTKVSTPSAGDIAYFDNGEYKHIGICMGDGKIIHCYSGNGVGITSLSAGGNLVGYGRLTN